MPTTISAGDTAWLLMSAALVMLMTPALGFFYGGLVRRKNVLATIMHSFFILALISVQWVLWGYTLAFGPDHGGLIGGLDWLALRGVGQDPGPYAPTVPHEAYMVFQMMFAVITPALITGAFAERKRFKAFVVFTLLWATFVYDPVAHWVWGGGWLGQLGALDFAGGTVVHITSGVSALVAAPVLGRRVGFGPPAIDPHRARRRRLLLHRDPAHQAPQGRRRARRLRRPRRRRCLGRARDRHLRDRRDQQRREGRSRLRESRTARDPGDRRRRVRRVLGGHDVRDPEAHRCLRRTARARERGSPRPRRVAAPRSRVPDLRRRRWRSSHSHRSRSW